MLTAFDVKLVLGCLHHVDVDSVADILDVHTDSIFMVEGVSVHIYRFMFQKDHKEEELGASTPSRPIYTVVRESCERKEMALLRAMECTTKLATGVPKWLPIQMLRRHHVA
jgi:hypothetical protein